MVSSSPDFGRVWAADFGAESVSRAPEVEFVEVCVRELSSRLSSRDLE